MSAEEFREQGREMGQRREFEHRGKVASDIPASKQVWKAGKYLSVEDGKDADHVSGSGFSSSEDEDLSTEEADPSQPSMRRDRWDYSSFFNQVKRL